MLSNDQLDRLQGHWERMDVPLLDVMRPGFERAELERIFEPTGLRVSDELATWWGRFGGPDPETRKVNQLWLGPDRQMATPEDALSQWSWWRKFDAKHFPDDPDLQMPATRLQVVWGQGALAAECAVGPGEPSPILSEEAWDEDRTTPRSASLGAMVDFWLLAFERGYWRYDATIDPERTGFGWNLGEAAAAHPAWIEPYKRLL